MKNILIKYFKTVSKHIWILLAIIVVGIFLRTYNFHDWLQFGNDQARDIMVSRNTLEEKSSFPLLGPVAGGTEFKLGPIYYYFQIISAKIFGVTPVSMAFPDLLFSILTIPLAYYFLKKYFSCNIALALTALISFSYFMVFNSRFACNANSIPFFVLLFLYASLEMMKPENKESYRWSLLFGLALGVGIQLHTLLIMIMPTMTFLILIFLWKRKLYSWKNFFVILAMAIFLNAGQIIYETKTGGSNAREFFVATQKHSGAATDNIISNVYKMGICTAATNVHFISSLMGDEDCTSSINFQKLKKFTLIKWLIKNDILLLKLISIIFFSLVGYAILIFNFRKEENIQKKYFLGITILFAAVSFLFFIPVARDLSLRYFNIVFIVPFVLFGLMIKYLLSLKRNWIKIIIALIFTLLFILNGRALINMANQFFAKNVNDSKNSYLGETELMAQYIVDNANGEKLVYFTGKRDYVNRFFNPLRYLLYESDIELKSPLENEDGVEGVDHNNPVFYTVKSENERYRIGMKFNEYEIKKIGIFNKVTILILRDYVDN